MFMYLGELIEYDDSSVMFSNPKDERTRSYLTERWDNRFQLTIDN